MGLCESEDCHAAGPGGPERRGTSVHPQEVLPWDPTATDAVVRHIHTGYPSRIYVHPGPVNVTLLGNKVFAEEVKLSVFSQSSPGNPEGKREKLIDFKALAHRSARSAG